MRRDYGKTMNKAGCFFKKVLLTGLLFLSLSFIIMIIWSFSQKIWDGQERVSFVIQFDSRLPREAHVYLVSYSAEEKSLAVVAFPDDMKLETAGGFGSWRVQKIYELGELEPIGGGELLRRSLAAYLATEIEGWIYEDSELDMTKDSLKKDLSTIYLGLITARKRTNLGYWDLLQLDYGIRKVLSSRINFSSLAEAGILTVTVQPDGEDIFLTYPDLLDAFVYDYFYESKMRQEALSIIVLNGTGYGGLGGAVARMITNLGGKVISVDDYDKQVEESRFMAKNQEVLKTFTLNKIKSLLFIEFQDPELITNERADLVIIVGERYWKYLN